MSRPLIRSLDSQHQEAASPAPEPTVSPPYDLKGNRLVAANVPATARSPRTLAGATILQIVPLLRDEPQAHAAIDTARTLLQAGARTIVAGIDGPLVSELRAFGGEWLPMASESMSPLSVRKNARALMNIIGTERIDIVHAHTPSAAWSALAARAHMPVWLVTSFGDRPDQPLWLGRKYHRALSRGDRIVAPSSFIAHAMIERYRIAAERISVIPRRIDTELFSPAAVHSDRIAAMRQAWGIRPDMRVVLVPSRVAPWNGQIGVVDAAQLLADNGQRNVAFVLAGDDRSEPAYRNALLQRARLYSIDTLVRLVGHCPDMPAALAAADIVVVPSLTPPLTGRAAAEAQAMGRPVVVNAVGVLPENVLAPPRMVEELRTGWVVPPGDSGELARAINQALSLDPKAYDAMSARARQFAEFMFSPHSVAAKIRDIYTSLLARQT